MLYIPRMSIEATLSTYIEEITGQPPAFFPLANRQDAPLPLFIRTLYELRRADLFGRTFLLAFQKDRREQPAPSETAAQVPPAGG